MEGKTVRQRIIGKNINSSNLYIKISSVYSEGEIETRKLPSDHRPEHCRPTPHLSPPSSASTSALRPPPSVHRLIARLSPTEAQMPASRTTRKASSDRACLECQKRKTKCVVAAEGQACTFCTKTSKSCVFEDPQHRTPLTRRNLDAVETRCKELEAQIQRLQEANEAGAAVENSLPMPRVRAISQSHSVTEGVPSASYEWTEVLDPGGENHNGEYAQDGMASLARRGNGSGYLGEQNHRQIRVLADA